MLLLAIVFAALALYRLNAVSAENERVEFTHNQQVHDELQDLRNAIRNVGTGGGTASTSVTLGARYPSRTVAANLPAPTGRLEYGRDRRERRRSDRRPVRDRAAARESRRDQGRVERLGERRGPGDGDRRTLRVGTYVDGRTTAVGGTTASANDEEFADLASGREYALEVTVTDVNGNGATATRTQVAG